MTRYRHKHKNMKTGNAEIRFRVYYLHMQMHTLCRAVEISITTSYSTSVKIFYRGLSEVFIGAHSYGVCKLRGRLQRKTLSSLLKILSALHPGLYNNILEFGMNYRT